MDNGETKDREKVIDTLSIHGADPFLIKLHSRGENPAPLKGKCRTVAGTRDLRLNDSDAFGIMWRAIASLAAVREINAKKRSAFAFAKKVSKKCTLSANNRIAPVCREIEKYRAKSAQTSILNCRRGRAFAEGAGITGCHSRAARTNWTGVTMARWLVSFARWRS